MQGLTLPNISLFLDDQFFAPGQAYTALSRAPSWDAVKIPCLNRNAFSVDAAVLREYKPWNKNLQIIRLIRYMSINHNNIYPHPYYYHFVHVLTCIYYLQ